LAYLSYIKLRNIKLSHPPKILSYNKHRPLYIIHIPKIQTILTLIDVHADLIFNYSLLAKL